MVSALLIVAACAFSQSEAFAGETSMEVGNGSVSERPADGSVNAAGTAGVSARPKGSAKKGKSKKGKSGATQSKAKQTVAKAVQTKKRPDMKSVPKPEITLESEPANYQTIIAYSGSNIFICNNGQWMRYTASKPKKGIKLTGEIKGDNYVLTEKPGLKYLLDRVELCPSKFKNDEFDEKFSVLKDSYANPISHGYSWSPVTNSVEGLYLSFSNFILLRKGDYWQEFHPDTYHGLWAEYRTRREDADNYYIVNEERELIVPKKISKTDYTYITIADSKSSIPLSLITDSPKTKLKHTGAIPSTLRTGAQTLAAVRYDWGENHKNVQSAMGSKGYISLSLADYTVCKDKNGLWQRYDKSKPNEAPSEWWLTGETDTHFILRDEEGLAFLKVSKPDGSGNLPYEAVTIELTRYGSCFSNQTNTAIPYFNSDAREVFFPKGNDAKGSYFVKDGTQIYEYNNSGMKSRYDIISKETGIIKAESGDGVKLTILPMSISVEKPGERAVKYHATNFESDTWAPRPWVKNAKMIAYEKAEAEKKRKAEIAAAAAEKKRKTEALAAEKKRKAEALAAEKKRKAEALAAEKRKKAERQKSVASTGGGKSQAGKSSGSRSTSATQNSRPSSQQTSNVCRVCKGSKTNECIYCKSTGRQKCMGCMGAGQNRRGIATGNGVMWVMDPCYKCNGSGVQNCISCGGSGVIRCLLCDGTGRQPSEMEMQIKAQNNREIAQLNKEIRESNEEFRNKQRQQERKEEYKHRNRRALCTYCNGTGASPMPESSQPSAAVGIKHYNSVGNKCPYCKSDEWRYRKHWHAQCIHCK